MTARRIGLFEAPTEAPASRLRIDPVWSPRRLSWALVARSWPWVLSGSLLQIVYNVARMLTPTVIGGFVGAVVVPLAAGAAFANATGALVLWGSVFVGLYGAVNLGYRFGGRLGWYGMQSSQYELAQAIIARVLDRRGMTADAPAPGRLLAVATGDAYRTCLALWVAVYPPGQLLGLVTAAVVLFAVHPILGLVLVLGIPVIVVLMQLVARPLRRRSMAEQAGLADAAASAADLMAGYRVLRGVHAHPRAAAHYRDASQTALAATLRARSSRAVFDGISTAAVQVFAAGIAVTAAVFAFTGQITPGELVTVAGVAVVLVGPLDALTGALGNYWAISQASAARVLRLLSLNPNPASLGTAATPEHATITFDGILLPDGSVFEAVVEPGEFVVLDVPQSAHRLLAETLAARTIPDQGDALIGGLPVHEVDPTRLRQRVLVAPHLPGILSDTVLGNVQATGDARIDDKAAATALRVASLDASELPLGYDTAVGDGGWELSGGQRQRVALARAVAADPEVLALVDPTTSVDTVTEQRIAVRLHAHRQGRTTIVLTSSAAFRAVADRVIVAVGEGAGAHV